MKLKRFNPIVAAFLLVSSTSFGVYAATDAQLSDIKTSIQQSVSKGSDVEGLMFNAMTIFPSESGLSVEILKLAHASIPKEPVSNLVAYAIKQDVEHAEEIIGAAILLAPDEISEILAVALADRHLTAEQVMAAAFSGAPSLVSEILAAARQLGVSEADLTSAALTAGLDPTDPRFAATAAGTPAPTPTRIVTGSGISPS